MPPELRYIKRLVTVLTGTMILGLLTITVLLVIRLAQPAQPLPVLPAAITLPAGTEIAALTFARGFTVVVTTKGGVLVYTADGSLRQSLNPE